MRRFKRYLAISLFFATGWSSTAKGEFLIKKQVRADGTESYLSVSQVQKTIEGDRLVLRDLPSEIVEGQGASEDRYVEEIVRSPAQFNLAAYEQFYRERSRGVGSSVWKARNNAFFGGQTGVGDEAAATYEVREILSNGPTQEKINLTVVGDGYTEAEKEKYFADVQRLMGGMLASPAVHEFAPMFNIYAVFVVSRESGITDIEKRDTALGLYRTPKGSKRGIMVGNSGAARSAVKQAPATDFPILIANDDFYGGLGGQYAITTRSEESGLKVLLHEGPGHNCAGVGEEYDGGDVYSGSNYSSDPQRPSWSDLIGGKGKGNEGEAVVMEYPWARLDQREQRFTFDFPGGANEPSKYFDLQFSSVGWATPDDVEVVLDGRPVELEGVFTNDRSFFVEKGGPHKNLAPGRHELIVRNRADSDNVLASIKVCALDADYDLTPGKYDTFAVFDSRGRHVGYRPTHESCLMRDMNYNNLCEPCKRGIRKNFKRILDGRRTAWK